MGAVASCAGRVRAASEGQAPQQLACDGCGDEAVHASIHLDGAARASQPERRETPLLRTIRNLTSRRMQPGDLDLTLPGTACGPDPLDEAAAIAFDLPPERRRTSFYPFTLSSRTPSCDCPTAELASLAALAAAQGGDGSGSGGGYGYCASAPPHSPQQGPDAAGPCLITAYIGGTSDPLWQLGGGRTSVASVASTGGHASVRSLSMPGSSPAVPAAAGMAAGGGADVEEECEIFERHTYGGYGGRAHAHGGNVHPWNAGKEVDAAAAATAVGAAAAVVGAAAAAAATAQAGLGVRSAAGVVVVDTCSAASDAQDVSTAGSRSDGCALPQLLSPRQLQQQEVAPGDAGRNSSAAEGGWAQGRSEAAGGGGAVGSSPPGRPTEPSAQVPLPPLGSSPPPPQQRLAHGNHHQQQQHPHQHQHQRPGGPRFDMGSCSTASQQALRCSRRSCDGAFAGGSSSGGRGRAGGGVDGSDSDDEDDLGLVSGTSHRAAAGAQVAAALTTKSTGTLLQLPDIHSGAHHAHHAHAAHHHRHQHQHDGDDDPHHPQGYHYLHQQQEQDARLARAQARSRSRGGWRHSDCGEYSFAATAAATGGIGAGGGGGGGTSRRFADCGGDTECGGVCSSRNRCPSSTCSGAYGSYAGEEGWRVGASGSLGSGTGPASSARTASVLHGVATSCGQGGADVGAFACGGGGGGGGGGGCGPGSGQLPQFSRSSASLAATAVGLGGAGATALAATTGHSTAVPLSGPGTGYLRINLRAALPGTVTSRAALAADLVRCLSHARRHARGGSASGGDGSGGGASPTASATPSPLMGEGGYMRARSRRERA